MRHRIPKRYTILISRTGKAPITVSFHPLTVLLGLMAVIALPTVSIGSVIYRYAHQNTVLTQRNSVLTEEAIDILHRLEDLEAEINHLQRRAGMPDAQSPAEPTSDPRGGEQQTTVAEALLDTANVQLPNLSENLKEEVLPALEQTLVREAARPRGAPLNVQTEVTSPFGLRQNPFGRGVEFHNGLDFKGWHGTPIHATAPGVVEIAGFSGGYGYHVIVDHGYGYRTLYAHMSKIEVFQGAQVDQSQVLGYVGSTGRSSGPHLHYTIYHNGKAVDPQDYLGRLN
jgi:murein DD-endopeptidase MepM/ murein hydrolase activator NlpD